MCVFVSMCKELRMENTKDRSGDKCNKSKGEFCFGEM